MEAKPMIPGESSTADVTPRPSSSPTFHSILRKRLITNFDFLII